MWPTGNTFHGEFLSGSICGKGTYTSIDQQFFEFDRYDFKCNFFQGIADGIGIFSYPNGKYFKRAYKDGDPLGSFIECTLTEFRGWEVEDASGESYRKGQCLMENGDEYYGEFYQDIKSGSGKMIFANGDIYEGEFTNDCITGKGTMVFKNGEIYNGTFFRGLMHGYGVMEYNNKDIFKGRFKYGIRSSSGKMLYANEDIYEGEFDGKTGTRHGEGILKCNNGDRYEGQFDKGKRNGNGIIYPNQGEERDGIWEFDDFQGDVDHVDSNDKH